MRDSCAPPSPTITNTDLRPLSFLAHLPTAPPFCYALRLAFTHMQLHSHSPCPSFPFTPRLPLPSPRRTTATA